MPVPTETCSSPGVSERGWRGTAAAQYIHRHLARKTGGRLGRRAARGRRGSDTLDDDGSSASGERGGAPRPDVSIVIVSYQTREMLAACLRSCRDGAGAGA